MRDTETITKSELRRCGCCGHQRPVGQVAELGQTPGVFICAGCALWAARRAGPMSALRQVRLPLLGPVLRRLRERPPPTVGRLAIPILPSTNLDRTADFYAAAGFTESSRYDGYLLLHNGPVELHFSKQDSAPGECYIHVGDALMLWKQLRAQDVDGVGEIADQEYGLREFVLSDPDGNRVRLGSPVG